ncbi:MAG: hypothetical protein BAJALOKI1v1_710019 [Promethearchaeota archaeon]|nr:MAG: hypothetical protein BAJALOKI1v1_710019 [Candidatus Lokiarchaeota archaeon]
MYPYSYDATEAKAHMPDFIVIPQERAQLIDLVKFCNQYIIPIVPYISGNNIGGLCIPERGGIIVDFGKKMNKILHVNEETMYAVLEPGVTFGQLKQYLDENYPNLRYSYPFAPPSAGVVGNVLLSGMNSMSAKIGSMADSINGLEVITADGEIVRIGSCFYGDGESDLDSWYCRYPMPDLMGLFVNWQGMTGLVTKCAVQLWQNLPYQKHSAALVFGMREVAKVLREIGKSEVVDDATMFCIESIKMMFEDYKTKKFPGEPDFAVLMPISAKTEKMLEAKEEILENTLKKLNEEGIKVIGIDLGEFSQLFSLRTRCAIDLPSVVLPIYVSSGLTWFGSYAPAHKLEELIEKTDEIYHKHNFSPMIYGKTMKSGHYAVFRLMANYNKYEEQEEVKELMNEIAEVCIDAGCIPYKTPIWLTEKLRRKINPGWLNLFEKVKKMMDPNNIFNPGRWNFNY